MSDLRKLSLMLEKDSKTVGRWAKMGFIPGARWTKGGHLRIRGGINARLVERIEARAKGFSRNRKSHKARKIIDTIRAAFPPKLVRSAALALDVHYSAHDMIHGDVKSLDRHVELFTNEETMGPAAIAAASQNPQMAKLFVACTRVRLSGNSRCNSAAIADALGISRSGLYALFGADMIQEQRAKTAGISAALGTFKKGSGAAKSRNPVVSEFVLSASKKEEERRASRKKKDADPQYLGHAARQQSDADAAMAEWLATLSPEDRALVAGSL